MTVQEFIEKWDPQGAIDESVTWDMSIADKALEAERLVEGAEELGCKISYEDASAYIEGVRERLIDAFVEDTEDDARKNTYVAENDNFRVEVPYVDLESEVEHAISIAYHDRAGNSWETILRGLVLSRATKAWEAAFSEEFLAVSDFETQADRSINALADRMIFAELMSGLGSELDINSRFDAPLEKWAEARTNQAVLRVREMSASMSAAKREKLKTARILFDATLRDARESCNSRRLRRNLAGWKIESLVENPCGWVCNGTDL